MQLNIRDKIENQHEYEHEYEAQGSKLLFNLGLPWGIQTQGIL